MKILKVLDTWLTDTTIKWKSAHCSRFSGFGCFLPLPNNCLQSHYSCHIFMLIFLVQLTHWFCLDLFSNLLVSLCWLQKKKGKKNQFSRQSMACVSSAESSACSSFFYWVIKVCSPSVLVFIAHSTDIFSQVSIFPYADYLFYSKGKKILLSCSFVAYLNRWLYWSSELWYLYCKNQFWMLLLKCK